jgi:hypothetical protein
MNFIDNNMNLCDQGINKKDENLFFSLVDYRNNLFTSNNVNKILEFYNSFENKGQLLQWIRERPTGASKIYEVNGDKNIIVVIPTADFNGKYAKECRENIFKGLHIIFVESGRNNFYFNYAHNCNVGIKKAMEYNPKWIIISNDDMIKVDSIEKLVIELKAYNENKEACVFINEGTYHSTYALLSRPTLRRKAALFIKGNINRKLLSIEKKFKINFVIGSIYHIYRFIYNNQKIRYGGSFTILNKSLVAKLGFKVFNENFINGMEDIYLAYVLKKTKVNIYNINYSIKDIIGGTIGPYNIIRRLRGEINYAVFSSLLTGA